MKSLFPLIRTLWLTLSSIVTIVVIAREITAELRPSVKPDIPKIEASIRNSLSFVSPESKHFCIRITGDSDLMRVYNDIDGATPEMSVNIIGNFEITARANELNSDSHTFKTFVTLCMVAAHMKNGRESLDFKEWLNEAVTHTTEEPRMPMHFNARFKAIHQVINGVIVITVMS